jgi:hypothetical protein
MCNIEGVAKLGLRMSIMCPLKNELIVKQTQTGQFWLTSYKQLKLGLSHKRDN